MKKKLLKMVALMLTACMMIGMLTIPAGAAQKSITDYDVKLENTSYTYTGQAIKPKVEVSKGWLFVDTLKEGTDYKVTYSSNTNVGTGKVTVTGIGSYSGTKTAEFKITAVNVRNLSFSKISKKYYNGKKQTPSLTVKNGKTTLVKGTDYTISYSNNKYPGKAKITVKCKGNYTGEKVISFSIAPKTTSVSVASKTKSSIKVSWKKVTGAKAYQVAYKRKGASSYKKTTTSNTYKNLSSLKSGTTYKIKVRAYAKSGDTKIYGKWSSVISVATKKAAAKKKAASGSSSGGGTVYIAPEGGRRYHFYCGCRGLRNANSIKAVSLNYAKSIRLTKCRYE